MKVTVYDVERGALVERSTCLIRECFPDDFEGMWGAMLDIVITGQSVIGGGAAPIVVLKAAGG